MKKTFHLEELSARHPCVDQVARWVHEEWGKDVPQDLSDSKRDLLDQPGCPQSLVAIQNDHPLGIASFRRYPVPELSTTELWLNMLYVDQPYRRQGVASELIRAAVKRGASYEPKLFVYTPFPNLYEHLGWRLFRPANEDGCTVLVQK